MPDRADKKFYLETFGCQMNVHDSEKVIGTLISEGYRQVQTVEEADLVLYNTCSIRDKAEQKVFHRLADYKKYQKQGKVFGDLGYTEIQLLGQNVNSYNDPAGKKSFAELLAAVGELPGINRVRFTTSHPRDFGKDIVEAIEAVPTLCDHVHLPVQSGSTRVLDAMQRLYTREQYLEQIGWMKAATREISITTDVIVGFPGETEADFEQTLN